MKNLAKTFFAMLVTFTAFIAAAQSVESYIPAGCDVYFGMDGNEVMKNQATKPWVEKLIAQNAQDPQLKDILSADSMNGKVAIGVKMIGGEKFVLYAVSEQNAENTTKGFENAIKMFKDEVAKDPDDTKIVETTINGKKAISITDDDCKGYIIKASDTMLQLIIAQGTEVKPELLKSGKAPFTMQKDALVFTSLNIAKIMKAINEDDEKAENADSEDSLRTLVISIISAGEAIKIDAKATMKDAASVKEIKDMIDAMIAAYKENPETAAIAGKVTVKQNAADLMFSATLNNNDIQNIASMCMSMIMPMLGGCESETIEIDVDEQESDDME